MTLSTHQVKKLMSFEGKLPVSQLGLSLTLKQLQAVYQKMPSQAALDMCTRELNSFLGKYASVMEEDVRLLAEL